MADDEVHLCSPCWKKDISLLSTHWCSDCCIPLCGKCLENHNLFNLNHHVITADKHKMLESLEITFKQYCSEHSRENKFYCPSHDELVCIICVQISHGTCIPAVPVSEVSQDSKTSISMKNMDLEIDETIKKLEEEIYERTKNKQDIEKQKLEIIGTISDTRKLIDARLDKIQEDLMLSLDSKYETCIAELQNLNDTLDKHRQYFLKLKSKIDTLKQFASNTQAFVGMRKINENILQQNHSLISLEEQVEMFSLKMIPEIDFLTKCSAIKSIGEVFIDKFETKPQFISTKSIKPGLEFGRVPETILSNKKVIRLPQDTWYRNICLSCAILPDNTLIFLDKRNKRIITIFSDGVLAGICKLTSEPFDITVIENAVRTKIAISFPWSTRRRVDIMSIKELKVESTISFKNMCYGISFDKNSGKLFVLVKGEGLLIMDITGHVLSSLPISGLGLFYVLFDHEKLYISDEYNHTLLSYNLQGKEVWKFEHSDLKSPRGLTSDGLGNVFVACYASNKILSIQRSGTQVKEVLTDSEGLEKPVGVYCSRGHQSLIICNCSNGLAFYYDLT